MWKGPQLSLSLCTWTQNRGVNEETERSKPVSVAGLGSLARHMMWYKLDSHIVTFVLLQRRYRVSPTVHCAFLATNLPWENTPGSPLTAGHEHNQSGRNLRMKASLEISHGDLYWAETCDFQKQSLRLAPKHWVPYMRKTSCHFSFAVSEPIKLIIEDFAMKTFCFLPLSFLPLKPFWSIASGIGRESATLKQNQTNYFLSYLQD